MRQARTQVGHADGEFHTHDFSALLMVTDGEFRVVLEDETKTLRSGDWCEVVAGTLHYEQTGADGATVGGRDSMTPLVRWGAGPTSHKS